MPPAALDLSKTITSIPSLLRCAAAVTPLMPAPITAARFVGLVMMLDEDTQASTIVNPVANVPVGTVLPLPQRTPRIPYSLSVFTDLSDMQTMCTSWISSLSACPPTLGRAVHMWTRNCLHVWHNINHQSRQTSTDSRDFLSETRLQEVGWRRRVSMHSMSVDGDNVRRVHW